MTQRLIFGLDATASRSGTWDAAAMLTDEMFRAVSQAAIGLEVQLIYYRGIDECNYSKWLTRAADLSNVMSRIQCRSGHTQLRRVLSHARQEAGSGDVKALVFIGDALEENVDDLIRDAATLGAMGCPILIFQEGSDPNVEKAYRMLARASQGTYCQFNEGAAGQLAELLRAVGKYLATGSLAALADLSKRRELK